MCGPAAPAIIAAAAAAMKAGAQIAQGVAGYQAGQATQKQYQAEARSELSAGNIEAGRIRKEGDAFLGQTRTIQAASGVDISTGSPADVAAESAKNIELDALMTTYGSTLRATQAITKGRIARAQGSAALVQGIVGGGSTLLTGGVEQGWFK